MTRVALDCNILIYAELEPGSTKGKRSADVILRAARDGVIAAHVLGEYLRFVERRVPAASAAAIRQAQLYQSLFLIPPTTNGILKRAAEVARVHRLQFWDWVVCAASAQPGAKALLTEDLQDDRALDGLCLINPFVPANAPTIDALLPR